MDFLVNKRSLDDFFVNTILPLVLYGCGTVKEILDMKVYEIIETLMAVKDKNFQDSFYAIHGLQKK